MNYLQENNKMSQNENLKGITQRKINSNDLFQNIFVNTENMITEMKTLKNQELLDMIYLEDDIIAWAEEGLFESEHKAIHRDSNGVILAAGDTVNIIKDLEVKGAGFTAKRGTAVRNISLPHEDETHIEGRVNGVKIMILTQYLKKA